MEQVINRPNSLILIVDDIPSNLKVLRGILEPIGYQLTFATSGKQTLERVKQVKPDLILLDLMMPDMDGLQVCQALYSNSSYQNIPIIFLTASQEEQHLIYAFEQGAVDYITKPFNKAELLARLKTHLQLKYYSDNLQHQLLQEKLINQITSNILSYSNLDDILNNTVSGIGELLEADRVAICRFNSPNEGKIVAEFIQGDWTSLLGQNVTDFSQIELNNYADSSLPIQMIDNISEANLSSSQINRFSIWQVKAELIWPLMLQENLWGVLIVDYCQSFHNWEKDEIKLVTQVIKQTAIAIQQAELYKKLQAANAELEHLAYFDGLTQIPNRRQFDLSIEREWFRLMRQQLPLSLILCDIDHFKQYNDFYGHLAGDVCLRQVARAIASTLKRSADLVSRYGGEEFALVLPNTSLEGAIHIAKLIQQEISQLKLTHLALGNDQYITISIGIASIIPNNNASWEQLIQKADKALYHAKTNGRNRFVTSDF